MTTEIIESSPPNEPEIVVIGENRPVSMKLIQSIYNEITGKTENLSRLLREDHEINFEDINQLNIKINQLYEQYNVISKACSVTVYHIDDQKQQFSSFERFSLIDKSSTSACENIRLTYEFLISLPGTRKIQPYKIEIDIHSRSAVRKRAINSANIPNALLRLVASRTAYIEIEFVDYNVARNFLTTIEHWYASVKKNKSPYVIKKLQNKSHVAPHLFQSLTILTAIALFVTNTESILGSQPSINTLFQASLIAFGATIIASSTTKLMGGIN